MFLCSHKVKMAVKLRTEYGSVLHMPVLKECVREKGSHGVESYGHKQYLQNPGRWPLHVWKCVGDGYRYGFNNPEPVFKKYLWSLSDDSNCRDA